MFEAPLIVGGKVRQGWLTLPTEAWRTFAHLCLDLTADRSHPYWSARPFSATSLSTLWPGPRSDKSPSDRYRSLRGAVESELRARAAAECPDVRSKIVDHVHEDSVAKYGGCLACATFLSDSPRTASQTWREINRALSSNSEVDVMEWAPVLISDRGGRFAFRLTWPYKARP
jgi:hypothetical protein